MSKRQKADEVQQINWTESPPSEPGIYLCRTRMCQEVVAAGFERSGDKVLCMQYFGQREDMEGEYPMNLSPRFFSEFALIHKYEYKDIPT